MNLLEELGKVAGAVAAEQGVANLDPNANFLEKAAAAVAGFEGAKIAEEKLGDAVENYQEKQMDNNSEDNQDNQN